MQVDVPCAWSSPLGRQRYELHMDDFEPQGGGPVVIPHRGIWPAPRSPEPPWRLCGDGRRGSAAFDAVGLHLPWQVYAIIAFVLVMSLAYLAFPASMPGSGFILIG
jgi:hypothetical protein